MIQAVNMQFYFKHLVKANIAVKKHYKPRKLYIEFSNFFQNLIPRYVFIQVDKL